MILARVLLVVSDSACKYEVTAVHPLTQSAQPSSAIRRRLNLAAPFCLSGQVVLLRDVLMHVKVMSLESLLFFLYVLALISAT